MNIETEHLDNHTARLTVQVDAERVEGALRQAARRISKKGRIPGFRPGKAPLNIVLNLYGREYVLGEALDTLGNEIYREALEQADIDPFAPGSLEDFNEEDGLKLTFVVPKQPTVELGDYREIRVPLEVNEVTDEMVARATEGLREGQAVIEDVERPAEMSDLVTIGHLEIVRLASEADEESADEDDEADESEAEVAEDDAEETADGDESEAEAEADEDAEVEAGEDDEDEDEDDEMVIMHEHDYQAVLRDDDEDLFPGFSQALVGASAGDELEFTLDIPADFEDEDVAGRTLRVEAHIAKVQSRLLPEWSDELAERISEGEFKTILELRQDVRRRLEQIAKDQAEGLLVEQALDKLVEGATIHYPEELVQEYIDGMLADLDQNFRRQGLTLDDYLKIVNTTREAIGEQFRERAVQRAERALALGELVMQEQLGINDADLNAEIDRLSQQIGGEQAQQVRQILDTFEGRTDISSRMVSDRAAARLAAIAKGENPPVGVEAEAEVDAEAETTEAAMTEDEQTAEASEPEAALEEEAAAVEAPQPVGDGDEETA